MITKAPAVVHSSAIGSGSATRVNQFMIVCRAHSLGSNGCSGARNTATKSTRFWNPSGRASCSGPASRTNMARPPTATTVISPRMSRVRRAGKTLTRISVIAEPMTPGMMNKGTSAAAATSTNNGPPCHAMP